MFSSHVFDNSLKPARIGNKNRMKYIKLGPKMLVECLRAISLLSTAEFPSLGLLAGMRACTRTLKKSTRMKSVD